MIKFGLTHQTTIEYDFERELFYQINFPLTVRFEINKSINAQVNQSKFYIYNLSQEKANNIFHDLYNKQDKKTISFEAGYKDVTLCFQGDIFEAYTERVQSDLITTIDARDGGYNIDNSYFSKSFAPATSESYIVQNMIDNLGFIKGNLDGVLQKKNTRGETIEGKTWQVLQDRYPGTVFVENNVVNILSDNNYIKLPQIKQISSESGLLGTPKKQNNILYIDMLFEPSIILGEIVDLQSSVNPYYDGQYKIIGYSHKGVIGGLQSDATTSLQLSLGTFISQFGGNE